MGDVIRYYGARPGKMIQIKNMVIVINSPTHTSL